MSVALPNTFNPVSGQAPTSNTNAVLSMGTPAIGYRWSFTQVLWSYSGVPTAGSLIITWTDGGSNTFTETYYITGGGPNQLTWNQPRMFPVDYSVTITLAAGGSGITGTVYCDGQQRKS